MYHIYTKEYNCVFFSLWLCLLVGFRFVHEKIIPKVENVWYTNCPHLPSAPQAKCATPFDISHEIE